MRAFMIVALYVALFFSAVAHIFEQRTIQLLTRRSGADRAAWEARHVNDPNCPKLASCYWYPDRKTRTPMGEERSKWMTDIQWENYQKNKWPIFQNAMNAEVEETVDGAELVIRVSDIEGRTASFWVKSDCDGKLYRDHTCGGEVRDVSPY
jgi:hypothetical protein